MAVTYQQVELLMKNFTKTGQISAASAKAGMCRQTGAKFLNGALLASSSRPVKRPWRTREDPLSEIWERAVGMLEVSPELEAKALFDWLCEHYPDVLQDSHLRTFQRRVRQWRASSGPDREVYFPQTVAPGRRLSVDFTHMDSLEITISGIPFPHMLCHSVLSYSGWEWATVCFSESIQALRFGVQEALFRLGYVPKEIWTDNSTSATHNPSADEDSGKRRFNTRYLDLTDHFGMKPHTIAVGKSNENGAVESANGHLKRRLEQHLLLRGSCDFDSRSEYEAFLCGALNKANNLRRDKLRVELASMPELKASRLAEWDEEHAVVRKWSTVSIARNTYSVPSRLIGEKVCARVHEDHIRIYYNGELQLQVPRTRGRGSVRVDYRHVIRSLVRKPGAFREYRYREELFPTLNFRKTYDRLTEKCVPRTADLEYLRILKLAADTMESSVDAVLEKLLDNDTVPRWTTVEEFMPEVRSEECPQIQMQTVDLGEYDSLLLEVSP